MHLKVDLKSVSPQRRVETKYGPLEKTQLKQYFEWILGGDEGDRTPDLNAASVALSQLSYVPGRVGGVPKGIRTPVAGVKGRCPRPTRRWGPINKQIIMKES